MKKLAFLSLAALILLQACVMRIGSKTDLSDAPAPTVIPLVATAEPFRGPGVQEPEEPLALPPGFAISVYAEGLSSPRMIAFGSDGQLYVAERGADRIVRLPDLDGDGQADGEEPVATDLNDPSSLAFYQDGSLYVGETTRVVRLSEPGADGAFNRKEVIVDGLPDGGHNTRTVAFSPDFSSLFVSIGSSCNICIEEDERRAAIMRYNPDGSSGELYAGGLRNAVGLAFRPGTDELWATNNGRDMLGDDLPPEAVYRVLAGADYGWPGCHAGRIIDPDFGGPDACSGIEAPQVEIPAHSAPLGLAFYSGNAFPAEYRDDLYVALHGSWNRSTPTGYKIVRVPLNNGTPGPVEDFVSGWLVGGNQRWGRPVGLAVSPDGALFVSDDGGGRIYRIFAP